MPTYTAQTRANLADVFDLAIKAEDLANTEFEMLPASFREYFYVKPIQTKDLKLSKIGGPASLTATNEGSDYTEKDITQGYDHTLTVVKYTGVVPLTEEAIADDPKGTLNAQWLGQEFAKAYIATAEAACATILNNGFTSTTTPDGQVLFSDAHLLTSGGTTYSNLITSALDAEGAAITTAFRKIRDNFYDTGSRRVNVQNWCLVVPPALKQTALKCTTALYGNQTYASPTPVQSGELMGRIRVVEVADLSSPTAWFLVPDPMAVGYDCPLIMLDRQPLRLVAKQAQSNMDYELYGSARFVAGVKGYQVLGSTGGA